MTDNFLKEHFVFLTVGDTKMEITSAEDLKNLSLYEIAKLIRKDWKKVYFGAVPYLDAMTFLRDVDSSYGQDSGKTIVNYFLSNATTYRGPQARLIKAELKNRIK